MVGLESLAPQPEEVYCKGDFKGLVFTKFPSQTDRAEAVKALKKAGLKENGREVWAKEHLPVEIRAPKGLFLGLKHLLNGWEIHGAKVSEEMTELKVGTEPVLSVTISNNKLDIIWASAWGEWKELVEDPDVLQLIEKAKQMVERVPMKSKGKGPRNAGQ